MNRPTIELIAYIYPHVFFKSHGNIAIASVRPPVRPSRYLLLSHLTKSNQIWCVSRSHETHIFCPAPWGPLGGAKRSNTIKFQIQSLFQRFLNKSLCLLTNERYKTYQTGPVVGLGGTVGGGGGRCTKCFFSEIQPDLVFVCLI